MPQTKSDFPESDVPQSGFRQSDFPQSGFSAADHGFMERAIALAEAGDRRPGGSPIGAVIVLDGKVIGESYNETELRCDPTAHGEIMAMRRAGKAIGAMEMRGATLYTTLQPCGMCSMASIWAKIGRIVYGAERHQVHDSYFEDRNLTTEDFLRDAYRDDLHWQGGLLAGRCAALYPPPDAPLSDAEQPNL